MKHSLIHFEPKIIEQNVGYTYRNREGAKDRERETDKCKERTSEEIDKKNKGRKNCREWRC